MRFSDRERYLLVETPYIHSGGDDRSKGIFLFRKLMSDVSIITNLVRIHQDLRSQTPFVYPSICPFSPRPSPATHFTMAACRPFPNHFQSAFIISVQPPKSHSSPCRPHRVTVPDCLFFVFPFSFSFFVRVRDVDREDACDMLF